MRTHPLAFVVLSILVALPSVGCERAQHVPTVPDSSIEYDFGTADGGMPDLFRYPDATVDTCAEAGATLGDPCTGPESCDDGCFCNGVEVCTAGSCAAGADPCTDTVECTLASCLEETDTCFEAPQHEMCSDGDACNGMEVCDPDPLVAGCRSSAPLYCNDESACTIDSCDPAIGCVYRVRDLDGDGFTDGRCGGDDCDDDPRTGRNVHPGSVEICDNRIDDDCNGYRDYNDAACLPTNDTCASAIALPGAGTYSGSTRSLAANYTLGCGGGSGADAVFTFTLAEPQDVRASEAGAGDGAVTIRALADCAVGPEIKCGAGTAPTVLVRSLPAGDYAIIVKTTSAGAFDLNLRITPPTVAPLVDVCNASTVDVSAGGAFTGSFDEVADDYTLPCYSYARVKDAVYRFTLDAPKDVTIDGSTNGSYPYTYLNLTTDCASSSSSLACTSGYGMTNITRSSLAAGTYYIVIEPFDTSATTWTIDVSITDPLPRPIGDTCVSPVDITTTAGSLSTTVLSPYMDGNASCLSSSAGYVDAYFMFDVAVLSNVEVTTRTTGSGDVMALQTSCGSAGSDLRCRSTSGVGTQLFRSLAPGRYYVLVATNASFTTVSASVRMLPPTPTPLGDLCSTAVVLTPPSASVTGTLAGFEDDAPSGACTSGDASADAFYTFTLDAPTQVAAIATRTAGGIQELVLRRDTCNGAQVACASAAGTAAVNQALTAGTYILQVEQSVGSGPEGAFTLSVFFTPL
jgi:hypothetical protein